MLRSSASREGEVGMDKTLLSSTSSCTDCCSCTQLHSGCGSEVVCGYCRRKNHRERERKGVSRVFGDTPALMHAIYTDGSSDMSAFVSLWGCLFFVPMASLWWAQAATYLSLSLSLSSENV